MRRDSESEFLNHSAVLSQPLKSKYASSLQFAPHQKKIKNKNAAILSHIKIRICVF